jgi:bidirectional [NiFe] hydrogenase diaphorase subunit
MPVPDTVPVPDDPRRSAVDRAMQRHRYDRDALIEVLHVAQDTFGHLDRQTLAHIARGLSLPPSIVYGVATFYHFFTLEPQGEHICGVCRGTACHIKGSGKILSAIEQRFGTVAGQTGGDGRLTVAAPRCVGNCVLAPLVLLDGRDVKVDSPAAAVALVEELLAKGEAT